MRRRLIFALFFLASFLIVMTQVLITGIDEITSVSRALIEQSEARSLVNSLLSSIKNAQLVVFMRQAGYEIDNDKMIDEINRFDRDLIMLRYKYRTGIETKGCLECHVTIDMQVTRMKDNIDHIEKLIDEYKLQVSSLFTAKDEAFRKKRRLIIADIGTKVTVMTSQIHHVIDKMVHEIDLSAKEMYFNTRRKIMWALGIGLTLNTIIIVLLIFTLSGDVDRFIHSFNLIAENNFNEEINQDMGREMQPVLAAVNQMIGRLKEKEAHIQTLKTETRKLNFELKELNVTLEDKVRQRNEELTKTNHEMIKKQLLMEKTFSELQEKNKTLEHDNKRLADLERMKSEFIQMANHEIRTPLVTILGYIGLLLEGSMGDLSNKAVKALENCNRSVNRLTSIVENIRSYTLMDNNRRELLLREMDVKKFLSDIHEDVRLMTEQRKQHFNIHLQPDYPTITCNVEQIYQAVINLLINSIRYSPDDATIDLSATYEEGASAVTFTVKDTGMGIEKDELKNIFLPFYEVKNIREHHSGTIEFNSAGTGLGLAIVKKIVERHGGRIWAESGGLWKGSSFHFTLPIVPNNGSNKS